MSEAEWLDMFARNLRDILSDYRMTQAELAEMSGLSEATISSYMNGRKMPGVKAINNMAYVLGVSADELIDFECMIQ